MEEHRVRDTTCRDVVKDFERIVYMVHGAAENQALGQELSFLNELKEDMESPKL